MVTDGDELVTRRRRYVIEKGVYMTYYSKFKYGNGRYARFRERRYRKRVARKTYGRKTYHAWKKKGWF